MKKTLVAVAALVATGAFAEVTLTGNITQNYSNTVVQTSSSASSSVSAIGNRNSALGDSFITFAGSEDLGNGLKASFKIEPRVNINGSDSVSKVTNATTGADQGTVAGSGSLFGANREAHVDLSGAFGSVAIGNNYTPMFLQVIAPTDVNGSTNAPGYLVSNNTSFNATNSIAYTLPTIVSGLNASLAWNRGGADGSVVGSANAGNSTGYGLSYSAGGFYAGFASETTQNTALTAVTSLLAPATVEAASINDTLTKTAYGLSYNFGVAKVTLAGVNASLKSDSINTTGYGVSIPFGEFSVNLSSSTQKTVDATTTKNYSGSQLGLTYALSKRTSAYVLSSKFTNTTDKLASTQNSIGVSHAF